MRRGGSVVRFLALSVGLGPFLVVTGQSPAAAQAAGGSFACRASALTVLGIEPLTANVAGRPCIGDSRGLPALALGVATVGAISATTAALPGGGGATAKAQVAGLDLPLLGLHAGVVSAEASVVCEAGRPRLSSTSQVLGVTVAGSPLPAGAPADVALPIGVLHLNHTSVQGDKVVVRALWLESALGNIVIGEAQAGFAGAPCPPDGTRDPVVGQSPGSVTIVIEAAPPRDLDFTFTGDLGSFSLNVAEGTDRRTFSVPPGRYAVTASPQTGGPFAFYWDLDSVSCVDPDRGSTSDVRARRVTVDLDLAENVVCTFRVSNALALASDGIEGRDAVVPVVDKTDPGSQPGSDPRGGIEPSGPPVVNRLDVHPASASSAGFPVALLVGLLALALVGAGLWFLLGGARRRRDQPAYA